MRIGRVEDLNKFLLDPIGSDSEWIHFILSHRVAPVLILLGDIHHLVHETSFEGHGV
jgi:hypothetical protein